MARVFLKTRNRGGHKTYVCVVCHEPIVAGDQYYTWKENYGPSQGQHATHGSPRRSQTSNSKMGEVWDAVDTLDLSGCGSPDDITAALQGVAEAAENVAAEYNDSADNIESSWPSGNPTSEACRETASALESWASDLTSWAADYNTWEEAKESYDDEEAWMDDMRSQAEEMMGDQPEYQG